MSYRDELKEKVRELGMNPSGSSTKSELSHYIARSPNLRGVSIGAAGAVSLITGLGLGGLYIMRKHQLIRKKLIFQISQAASQTVWNEAKKAKTSDDINNIINKYTSNKSNDSKVHPDKVLDLLRKLKDNQENIENQKSKKKVHVHGSSDL